jgi:hypothetical protein
MLKRILLTGIFVVFTAYLVDCVVAPEQPGDAEQIIRTYFDELSTGDYATAAEFYGGSYEVLQGYNPDVDPEDHAALLQRACEANGFQCLPVRSVSITETTDGDFIAVVEFNNPDGSLFSRGPCCGEDEPVEPETQFIYRVVQNPGGALQVMDLPVYVP